MDTNYRFVSLLDSAKTAHFSSKAIEKDNWWIPDDNKTWLMHLTSAAAISIKQILWGEIICIPRNQYLDSPAWLNIADYLTKSKTPCFSISIYDSRLELTPNGFLLDCANQFKNIAGTSMFAMSGWPGFSPQERSVIYQNIISHQNFKKMFQNIKVDSKNKEFFEYQRDVLQNVFDYLSQNYLLLPDLLIRSNSPKSSMWQKLEMNFKNPKIIDGLEEQHGREFAKDYKKAFQIMKNSAKGLYKYRTKEQNKWLNQRSNLYQCIFEYDHELRELLLIDIDKSYNETIGESVANGRMVFSDRADSFLPYRTREKHIELLDNSNLQSGLSEKYAIIPEKVESDTNLLQTIITKINENDIQEQIKSIRDIRNHKELPMNYVQEKELAHLNFLCENFSNIVVKESVKSRIVEYSYNGLSFGVKVVANHILGQYLSDSPIPFNPWFASVIEQYAGDVLEKAGIKVLPVKEKIGRFFVQKDKEIINGRIRDWLSFPLL